MNGIAANGVRHRLLVFDSGIGGLTIQREIRALLPAAELVYLADLAGFPYGARDAGDLGRRILALMDRVLPDVQPDALVVACNTASTLVLDALRAHVSLPVIGCVPPVKWAAAVSKTRHFGLLATAATVRRPYLQDLIRKFCADCTVASHGSSVLASLAEDKFYGRPLDTAAVAAELGRLLGRPDSAGIDTVVLGCTHYPFLQSELAAAAPWIEHWLDPAGPVARRTAAVLDLIAPPPSDRSPSIPGGTALFTALPPEPDAAGRLAPFGLPRLQCLG